MKSNENKELIIYYFYLNSLKYKNNIFNTANTTNTIRDIFFADCKKNINTNVAISIVTVHFITDENFTEFAELEELWEEEDAKLFQEEI